MADIRAGIEPVAGFFLMLLVRGGLVRAERGAEAFSLVPGSLFLAPPGSGTKIRPAAGAAYDSFSFGPSLIDAFASESSIGLAIETLVASRPRSVRLRDRDFLEAQAIFAYLRDEAADARPSYLPIARLKVMELLVILSRGQAGAPAGEGGKPGHFKAEDLKRFIEEHYSDQFSLDELARRFSLNPAYLSRAFSREAGSTIVEYLNRVRIQRSCALLKRSSASILEIAYAVGYNSLTHFNRYFRRIMGMSPREFRLQSRR
jgi:AraC-like DNA-binding protein